MIIRSKFKDYYDYVCGKFGIDEEVVYNRFPIKDNTRFVCADTKAQFLKYDYVGDFKFEYIVAGTYIFPIVYKYKNDLFYTLQPSSLDEFYQSIKDNKWKLARYKHLCEPNCRLSPETIAALVKTVGHPTFKILDLKVEWPQSSNSAELVIYVDSAIPILKDYKVAALASAEDMWKSIYTTITNTLRDNPDKKPPVELNDKDKIVKAGFDLKTSFRGK